MKILHALLFLLAVNSTLFADSWQRVYLATYPRSGNHWMRNLIEEATHVATGSVYIDREPPHLKKPFAWGGYAAKKGVEGNCRYPTEGEIVVLKTHYPVKPLTEFDLQPSSIVVRIVRHPIDAFYSHFLHAKKNTLPDDGIIPRWHVKKSVKNWKKFESYWNNQDNVFTIRYEDLLDHPHENFKKMMDAMGFDLSDEAIKRALDKFPPISGSQLKHLQDYRAKDLEFIWKKLGPYMQQYGYTI